MTKSIMQLKSIAAMADNETRNLINKWINDYVEIATWAIQVHNAEDLDHQEYSLRRAKYELGEHIAEKSNMYPTFGKTDNGFECRMSVLYLKKE